MPPFARSRKDGSDEKRRILLHRLRSGGKCRRRGSFPPGGLPEQVPLSDGHAAHSTGERKAEEQHEQHLFAPRSLGRASGEARLQLQTGLEGPHFTAAATSKSAAGFPVTRIVLGPVASFVGGRRARARERSTIFLTFLSPTREYVSQLVLVEDVRLLGGEASRCDGLRTT